MRAANLAGIFCLIFPASSQACQYFMYPVQHRPPGYSSSTKCQIDWLAADTDGDGVADWQVVAGYGDVLLPLDEDIDGDGIENFLDPEPFLVNEVISNHKQTLPHHVVSGPAPSPPETRRVQDLIYRQFGILTGNLSGVHSPRILRTLANVLDALNVGAQHPLTKKLKNVFASTKIGERGAHGYYVEPIATILIPGAANEVAHWDEERLTELVAHEIGHAAVFTYLSPGELVSFGQKYGGWQSLQHEDNFYSQDLRSQVFRQMTTSFLMPTRYARRNIHEWFAEVFALFTKDKMFDTRSLPKKVSAALHSMIY